MKKVLWGNMSRRGRGRDVVPELSIEESRELYVRHRANNVELSETFEIQ